MQAVNIWCILDSPRHEIFSATSQVNDETREMKDVDNLDGCIAANLGHLIYTKD